ncbi:hypothetical protein SNE40_017170 [Patella caerulea]|uniref:Uncharacterized protein n=1 Tax=Patella caerulea TaxID=87958 RepID=A0AAN8JDC2_PATCE
MSVNVDEKERGGKGERECKKCRLGRTQMLHMYEGSATIHGVPKIMSPQLYSFRRYLWTIMLIAMTIGLIIFLYRSFTRYYKYPIITNTRLEFNNEMQFPAVTICNANQFRQHKIPSDDWKIKDLIFEMSEMSVLSEYFKEHFAMNSPKYSFIPEPEAHLGKNLYKFALDAAHKLEDMFIVCLWGGVVVNCSKYFETVITDMGVCYTFNSNSSSPMTSYGSGSMSGLRVIVDIEQPEYYFSQISLAGIQVLLHEPGSAAMLTSNGFVARPGSSTAVAIRKERIDGLSKPYKAFGSEYCMTTHEPGFKTPLHRYKDYIYTRQTCAMNCLTDDYVKHCNCCSLFDKGEEEYCSLDTLRDCYIPYKAVANISDILKKCTCPSRCVKEKYTASMSVADFASTFTKDYMVNNGILKNRSGSYISDNVIDLRIYYETLTVTVTEQRAEITIETILGDLGGQMGLFIGASVLSVVELVEFVTLLLIGWHNERQEKLKTKQTPMEHINKISSDSYL